jgi:dTMP kinase
LRAAGRPARLLREPGGTPLGEELRRVLLAQGGERTDALVEALLFSASRRQLVVQAIRPALAAGETVLLDRSFLSTAVYQGVVGGVDLGFLDTLARRVHDDAWPDRILLLHVDPATALARRRGREGGDAFENRGDAYLARVGDGFRRLALALPDLVSVVPGHGTPDEVAARCWAVVGAVVAPRESGG